MMHPFCRLLMLLACRAAAAFTPQPEADEPLTLDLEPDQMTLDECVFFFFFFFFFFFLHASTCVYVYVC